MERNIEFKNVYDRNPRNYSMMSDAYEFFMSDAYLVNNKDNVEAVFDVFFRKVPNGGGYVVMAGLDKVIDYIKNLKFSESDIEYFRKNGYSEEFVNYLKDFKFTGDIYAIPDGTPVFPNEPLITVKAPIIEAQIVETAILSIVNGSMEHATGARRIIESVPEGVKVMEFGARRADGMEAAIDSSLYGIMAGCDGTSNVLAANMLGIKALGTMAHSFVETFDSELEAFIAFATAYPNNATLLVDTYDTLRSGVPNAIKTFDYMKEKGIKSKKFGIRLDSGDLAYLSKEARKMLDDAGYKDAVICASNDLDEDLIMSLNMQGAKIGLYGVGTKLITGNGSTLGGVYKLSSVYDDAKKEFIPKLKISSNVEKVTNPGNKEVYRIYDNNNKIIADLISFHDEEFDDSEELTIFDPVHTWKKRDLKPGEYKMKKMLSLLVII